MKCAGVAGGGPGSDELLFSACWLDDSKLDDSSPPPSCDDELLDTFLSPPQHEIKPLPPFMSINGPSCHPYNAIAQLLPEENNNYPTQSGYGGDHDVVSSSTCPTDADATNLEDVKPFPLDSDTKPFSENSLPGAPDSCSLPASKLFDDNYSGIDDFAAMISTMADTTSQRGELERHDSLPSWTEIDKYLSNTCSQHEDRIVAPDFEFSIAESPPPSNSNRHSHNDYSCKAGQEYSKCSEFVQRNLSLASSNLQDLLTHSYGSLLHSRLQNGPPVKQEAPSSTSYGMEVISTTSPPGNAVSTTDGVGALLNGRYAHYALGLKQEGLCSPERILGYPHAHTTTPQTNKKRSRAKAKQANHGSIHGNSLSFPSAAAELSGLLGKEKPVHRCEICNRGFLNKSNIKVHLRTHTGEKPFRCDVCAKAFRQKAHLIKHQQIHKRIGRD